MGKINKYTQCAVNHLQLIKEYIFAGSDNVEAKRGVTLFCEDCTVLGVNFDPALNCGLYLLAVGLNPLPGQLRLVFETAALCSLVYTLLSFWLPQVAVYIPSSSQFKSFARRIKTIY